MALTGGVNGGRCGFASTYLTSLTTAGTADMALSFWSGILFGIWVGAAIGIVLTAILAIGDSDG